MFLFKTKAYYSLLSKGLQEASCWLPDVFEVWRAATHNTLDQVTASLNSEHTTNSEVDIYNS